MQGTQNVFRHCKRSVVYKNIVLRKFSSQFRFHEIASNVDNGISLSDRETVLQF